MHIYLVVHLSRIFGLEESTLPSRNACTRYPADEEKDRGNQTIQPRRNNLDRRYLSAGVRAVLRETFRDADWDVCRRCKHVTGLKQYVYFYSSETDDAV